MNTITREDIKAYKGESPELDSPAPTWRRNRVEMRMICGSFSEISDKSGAERKNIDVLHCGIGTLYTFGHFWKKVFATQIWEAIDRKNIGYPGFLRHPTVDI